MTFLLIVTVASMLIAAIMARSRGDSPATAAPIGRPCAALSAEIHETDPVCRAGPFRPAAEPGPKDPAYRGDQSPPTARFPRRSRDRERGCCRVLVGALVVGAVGAMAVVSLEHSRALHVSCLRRGAAALELVALGHERVGDQLTVHGVVRNPPSGSVIDQLTPFSSSRLTASIWRPAGRPSSPASAWPRGDVRRDGAGSGEKSAGIA